MKFHGLLKHTSDAERKLAVVTVSPGNTVEALEFAPGHGEDGPGVLLIEVKAGHQVDPQSLANMLTAMAIALVHDPASLKTQTRTATVEQAVPVVPDKSGPVRH